jgi:hypothetical protein
MKPEAAERAIRELNNCQIRPGARLGVVRSKDNRRLYVRGLPKTHNKEELKEKLAKVSFPKNVIVTTWMW